MLGALGTLLEVEGIEYSAMESEQLAWGWPWLETSQWLPQLAAIVALQREVGRRLFLIAATTDTAAELRRIVEVVAADRTVVVLLMADPDVVAARVEAREPDCWPGKAGLITHARKLAVSMPDDLDMVDACIRTDGKDARDVATHVRDILVAVLDEELKVRSAK